MRPWVAIGLRWDAWRARREFLRTLPARFQVLGDAYFKLGCERDSIRIYADRQNAKLLLARARIAELQAPMGEGLPGLTAAEMERLAMLAEECGEAVQAVGKVLRHGWESGPPYGSPPNRVALERELGDVRAIVNLMIDAGDVRLSELQTWQRRKRAVHHRWAHHQGSDRGSVRDGDGTAG